MLASQFTELSIPIVYPRFLKNANCWIFGSVELVNELKQMELCCFFSFWVFGCRLRLEAESKGFRLDDTGLFPATQGSSGKRVCFF